MGKLLFFIIIIGLIYYFYKSSTQKQTISKEKEENSEDLIMCEKCKTFYPKSEIINKNGKNICKDCYANS